MARARRAKALIAGDCEAERMIVEALERTTPSLVGLCPRILVCDTSEIARLGIATAMRSFDIHVAATAGASDEALDILNAEQVDLMLIDVALPGADETIRHAVDRGVTVIGTGIEADQQRPFAALIAGAVGYLTKDLPAAEWAEGIRAALRGEAPLSRVMTARLVEAYRSRSSIGDLNRLIPSDSRLTPREWEILTRVAEGKTNRAVGEELYISVETVRTHVSSILAKLGTPNRSAAAAKYHQLVRVG
jgi:NarL family two-component system response regulator LiaR